MEKNLTNEEALKKMKSAVDSIGVCMMAAIGGDGASRPMHAADCEEDGTIWFFTKEDADAGQEAAARKKMALHFSSPAKLNFLCVLGQSGLVHDKAKMEKLWHPMMKTWFPDGLETPGIALIRVDPDTAHYWESSASRIELLYSWAKAQITGRPADGSEGRSGELEVG